MSMPDPSLAPIRAAIRATRHQDESEAVQTAIYRLGLGEVERCDLSERAARTVREIRAGHAPGLMEKFLAEYGLNTDEGVALMCLAEAYLRTPDAETLDALISDKIGSGDWARHRGRAQSSLVNASTWALMLTGKVFRTIPAGARDLTAVMRGMVQRLGEPVARTAVAEAMKILGAQFVLGRTIEEALANATEAAKRGDLHSFDMLGEASRTAADARRYFSAYSGAIAAIADHAVHAWPHANPGISVKLSALHPRYETVQRDRVMAELVPRVAALARQSRAANVPFAIDAEEADRLDLSLDVIEAVLSAGDLRGWDGFGVVVQAYSKRCPAVLDWLHALCVSLDRRVSVRLVKGAYWDAEIKTAQVQGSEGYPVFTRKENTDVSYLACARQMFGLADRIYPQFATHNAHSVVAIEAMAPAGVPFEFQRLHGMGEGLHEIRRGIDGRPRRIYAPVGVHKDLLAYLVRRLLENGANSSFVNQLLDETIPAEGIARDPVAVVEANPAAAHPKIPLPAELYPDRRNSRGWNLLDPDVLEGLDRDMAGYRQVEWVFGQGRDVRNPAAHVDRVGACTPSSAADAARAIEVARGAFPRWSGTPASERAALLERTAELYEANHAEIMALTVREAGKTRLDAVAEVREAVDFLRYYAARARREAPQRAPLGAIVCISPWNFPCAIFTGQVAAALAAGNTVVAKPAEQSPLIALRLVELFRAAGVPEAVLQIVLGEGETIGPALTGSPDIAGVAFTGGTDTARLIDLSMARGNPAAALIAETGGLNAMVVDSTALPEQAVRDIVTSAFQSAGQRCSALRVLYLQQDIAWELLAMLEGAARELVVGDPWNPATDVGPVIDAEARETLLAHGEKLKAQGRLLFELALPEMASGGTFVAPAAFRLNAIGELEKEVFGPMLHVIEYRAEDIDQVVAEINDAGYGLTMGVHSRIDSRADRICDAAHIGNLYVNRNQIGAVVGVQPFGGEGLSGTGPKAGGPFYAIRFTRLGEACLPAERQHELPGPTGERNTWSLVPRGLVACLGPGEAAIARQVALAEQAGNTPVRLAAGAEPATLLLRPELALVLYQRDGSGLAGIRAILAARQGKRVPVIDPRDQPEMLFGEKVVSEDTTASGGNASLLAEVG